MNKKKDKVKDTISIDYENKKLSIIYFIPLLLIAGFVPLIVYAKYIDLSGTTQSLYWTGQQQYLDFFSYWKSRWVIVLTAIALVTYIILYKQKKLPFKNLKQYYIPLGIYAIFVIISTVFAKDIQTALWGFVDMYQGMFVLLSYVLITFLTINFVNNERDVNLFVNAFLFLMIVEGILGVGQYFGFDFFQTKIGKDLILPNNLVVEDLSFSFGPKTIYGTLFNTNFVGSFAILMLPLSIAVLVSSKTIKQRIFSGIAVALMILTWIGCNSRAGYLGGAVSFVFGLWLFRKNIKKYWKVLIIIVVIILFAFLILNLTSSGEIIDRLKVFNIKEQIEITKADYNSDFKFEELILGKDNFTIKTTYEILNFKIDDEKLYFLDENYKELNISINNRSITINDPRYEGYDITIAENYPGITVNRWDRILNFYFTEDSVKMIGSGGRIVEPVVADVFEPLMGLEKLASNRGYIWGRTIPLIKNYIFIGSGPDNYPLAFPQNDFLAKSSAYYDSNIVIDKPHNLYLQIIINTGLFSLISLLIVLLIYIIGSIRLYGKTEFDSLYKYIGSSCLMSVIGYLAAAMFNDNVVSVTPVFCIILAIGISINYTLKKSFQNNNH